VKPGGLRAVKPGGLRVVKTGGLRMVKSNGLRVVKAGGAISGIRPGGSPAVAWVRGSRKTRRLACAAATAVAGQLFKVGEEGFEPSHPFGHTDLNRARLPFRHPPRART
jgi:hypothetical protein